MKGIKKILAAMVSVFMIFGLSATSVFADEKNDSITINNAKPRETYNLYKLFDLEVDSETAPAAYSYKVNSSWADFFKAAEGTNPAGPGNQYVTINNAGYVTEISDPAALAKAAAEWTEKPTATKTVTVAADATTAVFSDLADGYWLVTSTLGTIAMAETTPGNKAVTINEKNPTDTIEKEVKEDSTGAWGEANDAQVGDTVEFKSTVTIVKGTRNVVVHDKMDNGLTYTTGSVAIEGLTKETEYTVNESPDDSDTFDITFTQSWIDSLDFGTDGFKKYEITYTAKLNQNAIKKDENGVAIVNQKNKTSVTYGQGTRSTWDETETTTHKFSVHKHATGSDDNLANAIFQVKKNGTVVNMIKLDDNNYRIVDGTETGSATTHVAANNEVATVAANTIVSDFVTVASNDIVIWGVDSDNDYAITELQAPKGYNKLDPDTKAVAVDSNNSTRVDVENASGGVLPSTGGIGTTIFYAIGSVLVVGAGILLISKKRMFN